jgi:hypothetical protein
MSTPTRNEQKLVDIMFQCVSVATDPLHAPTFAKMTREQRMEWAARQLNECGFKNTPVGASWGYLTQSPD